MKHLEPKVIVMMVACALAQVAQSEPASCDTSSGVACTLCEQDGKPVACNGDARGKMLDHSAVMADPEFGPNTEGEPAPEGSKLTAVEKRLMLDNTPPKEPARVVTKLEDSLTGGARFDSCEIGLTDESRATLDDIINRLQGKENVRIRLIGHADIQRHKPECRALYRNNQGLSEARAFVVAEYLKERLKLDPAAFSVSGRGDREPVASNSTPEGMAKNRRVDVALWYDEVKVVPPPPAPPPKEELVNKQTCGPVVGAAGGQVPFRITVDGVATDADGPAVTEPNNQRCVDVALEKGDIQIRYDALSEPQALNGWVVGNGVRRGNEAEFYGYTNYAHWVKKAEIRIFGLEQNLMQTPLAVVPMNLGEAARWKVPEKSANEYRYVLRVYDEKGRYDETAPKQLVVHTKAMAHDDRDLDPRERLIGWGENSLQLRNIPVSGGVVTVNGENVKADQTVTALGMKVPVGVNGRFAMRQILPPGPHVVGVSVANPDGQRMDYQRSLSIPDNDWFYVAIGDFTVGHNKSGANAALVSADANEYSNKTYMDGRGAFYLKGKIKGEYLLTMSADTRERDANQLFTNFSAKDPSSLLRRIDPDKYYPVYGDDSTIVEDAPTQGRFYVRLEKGDSSVMWGNFLTRWTGTELTQFNRGLYGANAVWNSDDTTENGEKRTRFNVFAAEPGTLGAREEFRGTGGSLYYLRHQDISIGSERLWVEVRDRDSGVVLARNALIPGQDYEVNYLQGRVLLRTPLSAMADSASLFRTGSLAGNPSYLVTTYEYVPGFTKINGNTVGLRASHWFGDYLQLGLTGYHQGQDQMRQKMYGADAMLRYKPGTYLRAELAQSDGAGVGESFSQTGGFDFSTQVGTGQKADAKRIELAADLAELSDGSRGRVTAYWQDRDKGYSGPGQLAATEGIRQAGLQAAVGLSESADLLLKADERKADSQDYKAMEGAVKFKVTPEVAVSVGARGDDRDVRTPNASSILSQDGKRTDGIVRVDLTPKADGPDGQPTDKPADWSTYGYVQKTLSHSGTRSENDRAGLGGELQVSERFKLGAEASAGDGGPGGKLIGDYRLDDRSSAYLGYTMETERPDLAYRGRFGSMIGGSRYRLNEQVSLFGEARLTNGSGAESLSQAFGVDLAPNDRWTYGVKAESGRLSDYLAGDIKRKAIGLSTGYREGSTRFSGALEYRDEDAVVGNRTTWLLRTALGQQLDPAWRLLGRLNVSRSNATQGAFYDGKFVELVTGAAYRPVNNDRWNTLFKYTYYYDIPSPGQVFGANSVVADYAQRSHVVSVDTIYDVVPWMSLGLKYGARQGELRMNKTAGDWYKSTAQLAVIRADFHWTHEWDLALEGRRLWAKEAKDSKQGVLVAAYRHFHQNVKAGVGYNFTNFSDNLTDLSFRSRGWFVNMIGKF